MNTQPFQYSTEHTKPSGYLSIVTVPSGANIFIDGIEHAELTPAIINLSPGRHEYRLVYPGFFQKNGIVNVMQDQTYNLLISVDSNISIGEIVLLGFITSFAAGLLLYTLIKKK